MAFNKIERLDKPISNLEDRVVGRAQWLKEYFDASPKQLMDAFNAFVDEMNRTGMAGDLGAVLRGNDAVAHIRLNADNILEVSADGIIWQPTATGGGGGGGSSQPIPQEITAGTNLNSVTTPGFYFCASNATAASLTNTPTGDAFALLVEKHSGVKQTLTTYRTNAPVTYIRNYFSADGWGAWQTVVLSNDINVFGSAQTINCTMADLQATINSLPKRLNRNITINVSAGTITDGIMVDHFSGPGTLQINGNTTSTVGTTTHTALYYAVNDNSNTRINVIGFASPRTDGWCFQAQRNTGFIYFGYCTVTAGVNTTSSNIGFVANENAGIISCSSCTATNKYIAVWAQHSIVRVWGMTGTGNGTLYNATVGGDIIVRNNGGIAGNTYRYTGEAGAVRDPNGSSGLSWNTTATITTTWTDSKGTAPYTQTVNISGMRTDMTPIIDVVPSTTAATARLQLAAWAMVGKIVCNAGSITVTCFDAKPTTAIPVQIKVV